MKYLRVLQEIGAKVGDPQLARLKDSARVAFIEAIDNLIMSDDYKEVDIPAYVKLKKNVSFSTNPFDASELKLFKIVGIMPDPQIARNYSFYEKQFSEMKLMSQLMALQPTATEVFYYQIGTDIYVVYTNDLGSEVLNETDFLTHAKWDVTNDILDSGGNAAYTFASNVTSLLTQTKTNLASAGIGNTLYAFTYTVAVTVPFDGDGAATITTGFASAAVALSLAPGTHTVYFTSKAYPEDFVISIVSGSDTEGQFSFDNVTLKRLSGSSNFNPDSDVLHMKYIEYIEDSTWLDTTDLQLTPIFLSLSFVRKAIIMAAESLKLKEQ